MLLDLTDIQARLDEQFLPLEPMLTGFRLVSTKVQQEDIDRVQEQLNAVLPEDFQSVLRQFDLGSFTIGPIAFCNTGDYLSWTIDNNRDGSANEYPWWGSETRPSDVLLIANSDPYAVLLNCVTGAVSVLEHGTSWSDGSIVVAENLEGFLRGLGTVFLKRSDEGDNSALADDVSIEVGGGRGNVFWQWLAD